MDANLKEAYRLEVVNGKDTFLFDATMKYCIEEVDIVYDRVEESTKYAKEKGEEIRLDGYRGKLDHYIVDHVNDLYLLAIQDTHGIGFKPNDTITITRLYSEFLWLFYDRDMLVSDDFQNNTADVIPTKETLVAYYILLLKVVYKK